MAGWASAGWGAPLREPLYGRTSFTYAAGEFEEWDGVLYLARQVTFGADRTLSLPEDGLIALNGGSLASAVVSSGELVLTSGAATTTWTSGTQTGPGLVRGRSETYPNGFTVLQDTRTLWFARVSAATTPNANDGIHLVVYEDGDTGDHIYSGIRLGGGGNLFLAGDGSVATANNTGTGAASPTIAWVCCEAYGTHAVVWYVYSQSTTIPETGWTRAIDDAVFVAGERVFPGFFLQSNGDAVVGRVSHFSKWQAPVQGTEPNLLPLDVMRPVWEPTADLFDTTGKVASLLIEIPAEVTVSAAELAAAITDAAVFGTTRITVRARRGAAPTGSYTAVDSLSYEAGAGPDIYLDVKFTSDGYTPVGLRPLVL